MNALGLLCHSLYKSVGGWMSSYTFYFYKQIKTNKMKNNKQTKVDGILIAMIIIGVAGTVAALSLVIKTIML